LFDGGRIIIRAERRFGIGEWIEVIMPLKSSLVSKLFRSDPQLQACLVKDSAHVTPGAVGMHVSRIHSALFALENISAAPEELRAMRYGPSTAAAVLTFKKRRLIINYSYETQVDNIVGKMTIASMDAEMFEYENRPPNLKNNAAWG
jgi:hypothetical protein